MQKIRSETEARGLLWFSSAWVQNWTANSKTGVWKFFQQRGVSCKWSGHPLMTKNSGILHVASGSLRIHVLWELWCFFNCGVCSSDPPPHVLVRTRVRSVQEEAEGKVVLLSWSRGHPKGWPKSSQKGAYPGPLVTNEQKRELAIEIWNSHIWIQIFLGVNFAKLLYIKLFTYICIFPEVSECDD